MDEKAYGEEEVTTFTKGSRAVLWDYTEPVTSESLQHVVEGEWKDDGDSKG